MTLDKRTREQLLRHCGELHEDDGVDPRQYHRAGGRQQKQGRKAKQLCRQVAHTLDQILAGEIGDDALRGLHVTNVAPAPDSSRLLVTLQIDADPASFDRSLIEAHLARTAGRFRCEIAAAITRRKTPALTFNVVGPG